MTEATKLRHQKLPEGKRLLHEHASNISRCLRSGRYEPQYPADAPVAFQLNSPRVAAIFRAAREKSARAALQRRDIHLPTGVDSASYSEQKAELKRILASDVPSVMPNKLCLRREIPGPMGPYELAFSCNVRRGRLIPWVSKLFVKGEPASAVDALFDFEFKFQNYTLVAKPDLRAAMGYVNDPSGPFARGKSKDRFVHINPAV